jgi:hypothetical protein
VNFSFLVNQTPPPHCRLLQMPLKAVKLLKMVAAALYRLRSQLLLMLLLMPSLMLLLILPPLPPKSHQHHRLKCHHPLSLPVPLPKCWPNNQPLNLRLNSTWLRL